MANNHKYVSCSSCNWVHFEVSLDYCLKWEKDWAVYFDSITPEVRGFFGLTDSPPKIEDSYLRCHRCNGSYKNFKELTDYSKFPNGSTISPILNRNEEVVRNEKI